MVLRLRDEDRRAVDLLLDRAVVGTGVHPAGAGNGIGNGTGQGHVSAFTPVDADVQARLASVQNVLQMLDMLPAEEPPHDLLKNTLRHIDAELVNYPAALRMLQPMLGTPAHQPHA